jgi:hypothetical protein
MAIDAGDGGRSTRSMRSPGTASRAKAIKGVPGGRRRRSPASRRGSNQPRRASACRRRHALAGRHLVAQGGVLRQPAQGRPRSGRELDPPGFVRTTARSSPRRISARSPPSRSKTEVKGRTVQGLGRARANHYLDCRIYAMAAAERLGLTRKIARAMARAGARPVDAGRGRATYSRRASLAVERELGAGEEATPRPRRSPPISSARSPASRDGRPHRRMRMLSRGI